jgi:isocitrate lyase
MAGKVLVSADEHIKRLNEARSQLDVMGLSTLIVARTDAEAAEFITSILDERDHPFLVGATTATRPLALLREQVARLLAEDEGRKREDKKRLFVGVTESEGISRLFDVVGETATLRAYDGVIKQARADGLPEELIAGYHRLWKSLAGLTTLAEAVAQAIEQAGSSAEEWRAFSRNASITQQKQRAKTLGINVYDASQWELLQRLPEASRPAGLNVFWDVNLPSTEENGYTYWMIQSGLEMAIARSKAFLPYADISWMEQGAPSVEEVAEWAHALIEYAKTLGMPQPLLANNTSPSFYWRGKKPTDEELKTFLDRQAKAGIQFNFITYGGAELDHYGMQKFLARFKENGMLEWANFQDEAIRADNAFVKKSQDHAGTDWVAYKGAMGRGQKPIADAAGERTTMAQFEQALASLTGPAYDQLEHRQRLLLTPIIDAALITGFADEVRASKRAGVTEALAALFLEQAKDPRLAVQTSQTLEALQGLGMDAERAAQVIDHVIGLGRTGHQVSTVYAALPDAAREALNPLIRQALELLYPGIPYSDGGRRSPEWLQDRAVLQGVIARIYLHPFDQTEGLIGSLERQGLPRKAAYRLFNAASQAGWTGPNSRVVVLGSMTAMEALRAFSAQPLPLEGAVLRVQRAGGGEFQDVAPEDPVQTDDVVEAVRKPSDVPQASMRGRFPLSPDHSLRDLPRSELTSKTRNALQRKGVTTVGGLHDTTAEELLGAQGIGMKGLIQIATLRILSGAPSWTTGGQPMPRFLSSGQSRRLMEAERQAERMLIESGSSGLSATGKSWGVQAALPTLADVRIQPADLAGRTLLSGVIQRHAMTIPTGYLQAWTEVFQKPDQPDRLERMDELDLSDPILKSIHRSLASLHGRTSDNVPLQRAIGSLLARPENDRLQFIVVKAGVLGNQMARYYDPDLKTVVIAIDEAFYRATVGGEAATPGGNRIFAERLLHELAHDNTLGSYEEELAEETRVLREVDFFLYEQLGGNDEGTNDPDVKAFLDGLAPEVKPLVSGKAKYEFFAQTLKRLGRTGGSREAWIREELARYAGDVVSGDLRRFGKAAGLPAAEPTWFEFVEEAQAIGAQQGVGVMFQTRLLATYEQPQFPVNLTFSPASGGVHDLELTFELAERSASAQEIQDAIARWQKAAVPPPAIVDTLEEIARVIDDRGRSLSWEELKEELQAIGARQGLRLAVEHDPLEQNLAVVITHTQEADGTLFLRVGFSTQEVSGGQVRNAAARWQERIRPPRAISDTVQAIARLLPASEPMPLVMAHVELRPDAAIRDRQRVYWDSTNPTTGKPIFTFHPQASRDEVVEGLRRFARGERTQGLDDLARQEIEEIADSASGVAVPPKDLLPMPDEFGRHPERAEPVPAPDLGGAIESWLESVLTGPTQTYDQLKIAFAKAFRLPEDAAEREQVFEALRALHAETASARIVTPGKARAFLETRLVFAWADHGRLAVSPAPQAAKAAAESSPNIIERYWQGWSGIVRTLRDADRPLTAAAIAGERRWEEPGAIERVESALASLRAWGLVAAVGIGVPVAYQLSPHGRSAVELDQSRQGWRNTVFALLDHRLDPWPSAKQQAGVAPEMAMALLTPLLRLAAVAAGGESVVLRRDRHPEDDAVKHPNEPRYIETAIRIDRTFAEQHREEFVAAIRALRQTLLDKTGRKLEDAATIGELSDVIGKPEEALTLVAVGKVLGLWSISPVPGAPGDTSEYVLDPLQRRFPELANVDLEALGLFEEAFLRRVYPVVQVTPERVFITDRAHYQEQTAAVVQEALLSPHAEVAAAARRIHLHGQGIAPRPDALEDAARALQETQIAEQFGLRPTAHEAQTTLVSQFLVGRLPQDGASLPEDAGYSQLSTQLMGLVTVRAGYRGKAAGLDKKQDKDRIDQIKADADLLAQEVDDRFAALSSRRETLLNYETKGEVAGGHEAGMVVGDPSGRPTSSVDDPIEGTTAFVFGRDGASSIKAVGPGTAVFGSFPDEARALMVVARVNRMLEQAVLAEYDAGSIEECLNPSLPVRELISRIAKLNEIEGRGQIHVTTLTADEADVAELKKLHEETGLEYEVISEGTVQPALAATLGVRGGPLRIFLRRSGMTEAVWNTLIASAYTGDGAYAAFQVVSPNVKKGNAHAHDWSDPAAESVRKKLIGYRRSHGDFEQVVDSKVFSSRQVTESVAGAFTFLTNGRTDQGLPFAVPGIQQAEGLHTVHTLVFASNPDGSGRGFLSHVSSRYEEAAVPPAPSPNSASSAVPAVPEDLLPMADAFGRHPKPSSAVDGMPAAPVDASAPYQETLKRFGLNTPELAALNEQGLLVNQFPVLDAKRTTIGEELAALDANPETPSVVLVHPSVFQEGPDAAIVQQWVEDQLRYVRNGAEGSVRLEAITAEQAADPDALVRSFTSKGVRVASVVGPQRFVDAVRAEAKTAVPFVFEPPADERKVLSGGGVLFAAVEAVAAGEGKLDPGFGGKHGLTQVGDLFMPVALDLLPEAEAVVRSHRRALRHN